MKPLGLSNSNPLNIRFSPMNHWMGQTGSNKGFCVFDSMEHGFRAALVLLCNYQRKGYDTIRKIVTHWAPPSENNTEDYISHCCIRCGRLSKSLTWIDADPDARITHYDELFNLAAAMCQMEVGLYPYEDGDFGRAFSDACKNYKYPELCA